MPRTRTDLVTEVLDLLGVSQEGQEPSAEERSLVDHKIDTVVARLAFRQVVYLQNLDAIEDHFFDPVAVIIANNVGPKFGQPFDPGSDALQEAILRETQLEPGASVTVHADYF